MLYPWRYRATALEESAVTESADADPPVENFAPHQFRSRGLPAPSGQLREY